MNSMQRLLLVLLACATAPTWAQQATTPQEARAVAQRWADLIVQVKGSWAGSVTPVAGAPEDFTRYGQPIGYYCPVQPDGFIIVSLYRQSAPVKAWSMMGAVDPGCEEGATDAIKVGMAREVAAFEAVQAGGAAAAPLPLQHDYAPAWEELLAEAPEPGGPAAASMVYEAGEVLLSTLWSQDHPYNRFCPFMDCTECPTGRALVGCVATAGAQVLRYWCWPPYGPDTYGPYNWTWMPNEINGTSPQYQIDAVALLSWHVGVASDLDYGCAGTGGYLSAWWTRSLEDALHDTFSYNQTTDTRDRDDYDTVLEWLDVLKADLNRHWPVLYRIPNHIVIVDGWQMLGSVPQYHVNYGHGRDICDYHPKNWWYSLDSICGSERDEEYCLINVFPAPFASHPLAGDYFPASAGFPYRYVVEDASGESARFRAGHYLQFFPYCTVKGTSTTGGAVRFESSSSANSVLFTRGDTSKGVRLSGGTIRLTHGGGIRLGTINEPRYLRVASYGILNVMLAWEDPLGPEDHYEVERKLTWEPDFALIGTTQDTSYTDRDITRGVQHTYRVRAVRQQSNTRSAYSDEVRVVVPP